ncbi:MAG: glycoside hydrolase family 2 TIM barrel-domain containing protein [Clostridia bacterium]
MKNIKTENFNFGWKFYEGTPPLTASKDAGYDIGNAPTMTKWTKATSFDYALSGYDDSDWIDVELPHDFVIEKSVFTNTVPFQTGSLEKNYGWYRKSFIIPKECEGNRVFLEFDGIYRDSQVWVNGDIIARQLGGFMGFRAEITEAVNYGEESVVAVYCDSRETEGWWYTGGGIYRDVRLEVLPSLCFVKDSIFIKNKNVDLATKKCDFEISFEVDNVTDKACDFTTQIDFYDADEKIVGILVDASVENVEQQLYKTNLSLENAILWSPNNPHLYKAVVTLNSKYGTEVREIRFAPKKVEYNPEVGMLLNGEEFFIKGVCGHDDFAGVGVALNRSIIEYKIDKLKEMGVNGYRCAHNPPSPIFLDLCDEKGILVMDENRWPSISDISMDLFVDLIRRDRNHASVYIWSYGNEESSLQGKEKGIRVFNKMKAYGEKYDDSRKYMLAINSNYIDAIKKQSDMGLRYDVNGVNYFLLRTFDAPKMLHKEFPEMCFFNTEVASVYNTRIYKMHKENRVDKISKVNSLTAMWMTPENRGNVTCYGDGHPKWGENMEETLKAYEGQKHMCGMFLWTGMDYRGETSPYKFPNVVSSYGFIDYCGFFKPWANYLKAYWTDEKIITLMPLSWNLFEEEGTPIKVYAMANCTEVELFLNGVSLGRQKKNPYDRGFWEVPYKKGELLAIAYENGQEIARHSLKTAGKEYKLELTTAKTSLVADGSDCSVVNVSVVDIDGNFVSDSEIQVDFTVEGDGKILGTGNGDHQSHEHDKKPTRKLHGGLAIAIVQSRFTQGEIKLIAKSKGVQSAEIVLKTV